MPTHVSLDRPILTPAVITFFVALLWLASAAAAYADDKQPRCFNKPFEGHCVAVTVNGQKTVRIAKKTKNMLKELGASRAGGKEALYEVPSAVRGALELDVDWLPEAVAYFGPEPRVDAAVFPLDGQDLDTQPELSTAPSVQAGGSAVVTQADVIQSNRLPPGRYVLAIRVYGSKRSWDRQTLFVQVAE
jgi:hypothetical protein